MKKLAIIVALMLVVSMFSACTQPLRDIFKDIKGSEKQNDKSQMSSSEDDKSTKVLTDEEKTIRWLLALSAFQMYYNGWDYTVFGGGEVDESPEDLRADLKDDWNVYDRASAVENMEWLILEGQKPEYLFHMRNLVSQYFAVNDDEQIIDEFKELYGNEEDATYYANAFMDYRKNGRHSIDAWDYCRAVAMLQWCMYVGYYTEDEALEQAYAIAKVVQKQYKSWDEYMESYFRGFEFYKRESSVERREMLTELKSGSDNPFDIEWNTKLVKSWQETKLPESEKLVIKDDAEYIIPDNWVISFWISNDLAKAYCKYGTHTDIDPDTIYVEFMKQNTPPMKVFCS